MNIKELHVNPQKDRPVVLAHLDQMGQLENVEVDFKDRSGKPFNASLSLRLIQYEQKTCIQSRPCSNLAWEKGTRLSAGSTPRPIHSRSWSTPFFLIQRLAHLAGQLLHRKGLLDKVNPLV
jgi:hypothetical protein